MLARSLYHCVHICTTVVNGRCVAVLFCVSFLFVTVLVWSSDDICLSAQNKDHCSQIEPSVLCLVLFVACPLTIFSSSEKITVYWLLA